MNALLINIEHVFEQKGVTTNNTLFLREGWFHKVILIVNLHAQDVSSACQHDGLAHTRRLFLVFRGYGFDFDYLCDEGHLIC
jgi:hypothetical protein